MVMIHLKQDKRNNNSNSMKNLEPKNTPFVFQNNTISLFDIIFRFILGRRHMNFYVLRQNCPVIKPKHLVSREQKFPER